MTSAFHTLIQACANIQLQPSLHKCHVYGTPGTAAFNAARTVAQTLHIPHTEQGFIAAGTPIGAPTYISQHASGRAGSRADIEARLPPPHVPLLDVSLSHPRVATYVTDAAATKLSKGLQWRNVMP